MPYLPHFKKNSVYYTKKPDALHIGRFRVIHHKGDPLIVVTALTPANHNMGNTI